MSTIKQTSAQWKKDFKVKILSFAGWDLKNFHDSYFTEEITKSEFHKRLKVSVYEDSDGKIIMPK